MDLLKFQKRSTGTTLILSEPHLYFLASFRDGTDSILRDWDGFDGNLAKLEKLIWFIEVDVLVLILVYFSGLWLLIPEDINRVLSTDQAEQ